MKSPPFLYLFFRVCQGKSGKRGVKINVSDLRKQASGFSDGYCLLYETEGEKIPRKLSSHPGKKEQPESGKRLIGKKKKAAL